LARWAGSWRAARPSGRSAAASRRCRRARGPARRISRGGPAVAGQQEITCLPAQAAACCRAPGCGRWGGVAVRRPWGARASRQPLMDRPVVGPAHQGQVGQVGGAAMQPVVGFAPGQGRWRPGNPQPPPRTARAARWVAGRPGGCGRPPAAGWGRRPGPRGAGSPRSAAGRQVPSSPGRSWPGWPPGPWWPVGWRVTRTRVTAPPQASRRHASGSSGPVSVSPPGGCRPGGCPGPPSPAAGPDPGAAGPGGRWCRVGDQPQVAQDPPQPGWVQPPGRLTSTGSASTVTWAGRSWVPWARTAT
jgi:hypothetical protein